MNAYGCGLLIFRAVTLVGLFFSSSQVYANDPKVGVTCFPSDLVGVEWEIYEVVNPHIGKGDKLKIDLTPGSYDPDLKHKPKGGTGYTQWGLSPESTCHNSESGPSADKARFGISGRIEVGDCQHTFFISRLADKQTSGKPDRRRIRIDFGRLPPTDDHPCTEHGHTGETDPGHAHGYD